MAILDSFEMVNDIKPSVFITLRNSTITFSKSSIESLNYAEYVHMYIDRDNHQVAFQPCEQDASSIVFYEQPAPGKQLIVRITSTSKAKMLMELAEITDCGKGIRYYGEYYQEENVLVFTLKQ